MLLVLKDALKLNYFVNPLYDPSLEGFTSSLEHLNSISFQFSKTKIFYIRFDDICKENVFQNAFFINSSEFSTFKIWNYAVKFIKIKNNNKWNYSIILFNDLLICILMQRLFVLFNFKYSTQNKTSGFIFYSVSFIFYF